MSMSNYHPTRPDSATAAVAASPQQAKHDRLPGRHSIGLFLCSILLAGSLSGCVALVPWVKPDAQARGALPNDGCPLSGLRPVVGGPELSLGTVSYLVPRSPAQSDLMLKRPPQRSAAELRIQQLIAQLQHQEPVMRTHAATDLGAFGPKAAVAIPSLAESIKSDRSEWVRRAAVKSLVKIGTPEAIPPLKVAQTDRNKWVAHSATNALRALRYRQGARSKLVRRAAGTVTSTAEPGRYRANGDSVEKF